MVDLEKVIRDVNTKHGLSFQPSSHPTEDGNSYIACFSGNYLSYGEISIAFEASFPYALPDIFIKNTSKPHVHVTPGGKICLTDESALLLDINSPEQLVVDCLDRVAQILSILPGTDDYQEELKKEFLSYWGIYTPGIIYFSILQIPKKEGLIQEFPLFKYGKTLLLANSTDDANRYICETLGLDSAAAVDKPEEYALVIGLKQGCAFPSPFKQHNWFSVMDYIRDNTDTQTSRQFFKLINARVKNKIINIIFISSGTDGNILFGVVVGFSNRRKTPMKSSIKTSVMQINLLREDRDYLLARGGSALSLTDKRVLLLGCGSVGGYLANNLCQMGITQIDLLDKDNFKSENVYRHFMGYDALRRPGSKGKADLLRGILSDKYPDMDIDSMNYQDRSVEAVILSNPERLSQYNLVISALGEPTINLAINKALVENNIPTPFIVCFNEPYGIGGHVITTNLSQESCLRCYYSDLLEGTLRPFRGSLVAPDQNFKKSLSGCSSTFVPYSALDSQQTAIHAAHKAIDVLTGKLNRNNFFTWRGDSSLLISEGYEVSDFYNLENPSDEITNPKCPVCQRRHSVP